MLKTKHQSILLIGGCGYLGSALYNNLLQDGYQVKSIDLEWYGHPTNESNQKIDFRTLRAEDLEQYQTIIHLAAYPNKRTCEKNLEKAFENNVSSFLHLLEQVHSQRIIYASSTRIYKASKSFSITEEKSEFSLNNIYNLSKFCMDALAQLTEKNYYGLRLGEVNGPSPNMRTDMVINQMTQSAMQKGRVDVYNPEICAPFLGINDFLRAIKALLHAENAPGIYNIASFNATYLEIGQSVSEILDVPLYVRHDEPDYNLKVKTRKFEDTFQFEFEDTIESVISSIVKAKTISLYSKRA